MTKKQREENIAKWQIIRILVDIFVICLCFYGFSRLLDNCSPGCGLYATQYYEWGKATHEILEKNSCSSVYIGNHWDSSNRSMSTNKIVCIQSICKEGGYCKLGSIILD
jgi:hypothetical protein